MPCRQDVKDAILNSVFSEFTNGRYTFNRISSDTIQINGRVDNGKTKALSNKQALAIAKELVDRTKQSFNGHVKGEVSQTSAYDPVTIKFTPSKGYIEHEYQKLPPSQRTDKADTESLERSHILTDTGYNTYQQLYLFAPTAVSVGAYVKMVTFKENQLSSLRNKLRQNQAEQKAKNITDAKLLELKRGERDLKLQIEGDYVKGIEGLQQEVEKLKAERDTKAVSYYVQKDLDRLKKLAESEDLEDLKEGQKMIEFYDAAGTFTIGKDNPFFLPEEIFLDNGLLPTDPNYKLTSDLRQSDATMQQYRDWRAKAKAYENIIEDKRRRIMMDEINKNHNVRRTFGDKQFKFEDVVDENTGRKDVDWFSMWTLDPSSSIWSNNGLLPQMIRETIVKDTEEHEAWSRDIAKRTDDLIPKLQDELEKLDNGKYTLRGIGIQGLKGVSYQLFKEIDKNGNERGTLIQRFTPEYNDEEGKANNSFWSQFNKAKDLLDPQSREQGINKAFDDLKRWKRNNSIIIDITKLSTVANDPRFAEFKATPDTNYENELIRVLGKKGFDEHVEQQVKLLRRYQIEKQAFEEGILSDEGKVPGDTLSPKGQSQLSYWESSHNPLLAIDDYKSIYNRLHGNNRANSFMDFNSFVARKYKPTITANLSTGEYDFTDTTDETGHYNKEFTKIEANPILSEFYDIAKEVCERIRDSIPYEAQQQMRAYSLPGLDKVLAELIADKNNDKMSTLSLAFAHILDNIRTGLGVTKQSEISYAIKDPVTGKENYKVNDGFLNSNSRAINERESIETANFLQLLNTNNKGTKLAKIAKNTSIRLSTMNPSSILELTKFLHLDVPFEDIKANRIDAIKQRLEAVTSNSGVIVDYNVPIGKLIKDYSVHTIVQSQSYDLPKLLKHFSSVTMAYAANQKALPLLEIMKHYYETIKKPSTTNLGKQKISAKEGGKPMQQGERNRANQQMDDFFKRVVLDNYGGEQFLEFGSPTKIQKVVDKKIDEKITELENSKSRLDTKSPSYKEDLDKINEKIALLNSKKMIGTIGDTIYSSEEKKKFGEIQRILDGEKYGDLSIEDLYKELNLLKSKRVPNSLDISLEEDITQAEKVLELKKIQQGLGKTRTASGLLEGMLRWVRTLRLGYNIPAAIGNFLDGYTSNMILAADGSHMDTDEMFRAYRTMFKGWIKTLTGIEGEDVKKCRVLSDKFRVVIDSTNELQKSSHKSLFSKAKLLSSYELQRRTEYSNQTPIMESMLRTMKIKGKNGNESSIWKAYNSDGKLKDEFRTHDNVENWENLSGEEYSSFRQNLSKVIGLGHGLGYDEKRGMMAKSNIAGKIIMMFKTWLPASILWRFAEQQADIETGKKDFKGMYRSYSKTGATLHGVMVGATVFGPVGAVVLGTAGFVWGHFKGTESNVSLIQETATIAKQLFLRSIGMPVNTIMGRPVINQDKTAFDNWINGKFTAQDAMNMRANMASLSLQLIWFALLMITKALLWDDGDDPDGVKRQAHNIIANRLAQLSGQADSYSKPADIYKNTVGSISMLQYLTDLGKEVEALDKWARGMDIIPTGPNAGHSRTWIQTRKIFMPGIFKDNLAGFGSEAQKEFTPFPYQYLFQSAEKKDKLQNEGYRSERRLQLESQLSIDSIAKKLDEAGYKFNSKEEKLKAAKDIRDKQIKDILNTELPTPAKLKKYGVTRDEYEQYLEQQNGQGQ